jgi:hypothetical protein
MNRLCGIIIEDELDGTGRKHSNEGKVTQNCFQQSERKRLLEKSKHRWENNIKIDLKEVVKKGVY